MTSLLGQRIAQFRIVDRLGQGGMGEVYVGYDEKLERRVAIKTIRAQDRLDAEARARFLREARILSQLNHPNICLIHDYIAGDEADVLVLELLAGRSLGDEQLKKSLTFRQKLSVSLQIARVLIAAHEKGIVHRDLKPENVMVDETGQVKVLDFGLSRSHLDDATLALVARDPEKAVRSPESRGESSGFEQRGFASELTTAGQIVGTLGYMSPEQAWGEAATPASDLYSLGLLMQELFTGKPSRMRSASFPESLAKAQAGEILPFEGIDPDVTALIRRLESNASAGRPSAVDTAERLVWILDKPARRTRRFLGVAAIVVLASLSAFLAWQTVRATRAEKVAREAEQNARKEAEASRQVTGFLVDMFKDSDPYAVPPGKGTGDVTARELLDRGVERLDKDLAGQPQIRARLLNTIGDVYVSLAAYDEAGRLLKEGLAIRERLLPPDHPDVAESVLRLAILYDDQGRYAEAEPLYERALAIREKAFGADHPVVAESLFHLAWLYRSQGRLAEAERPFQRCLTIRERALGRDHLDVASTLNGLAALYNALGRNGEAEPLYERALQIRVKALGPDHPLVATSMNNLGYFYYSQGRYAEAEPLLVHSLEIRERVFGPDHPRTAGPLENLGSLYGDQGRRADCERFYKRALAVNEKALGPDHPAVARNLGNLGSLYLQEGRYAEAESLFGRSLAIREKAFGPDNPGVAWAVGNLAAATGMLRRYAEAERLLDRSVRIFGKTAGADHLQLPEILYQFGPVRLKAGDSEGALDLLRRVLPDGVDKPYMASIRKDYAPLAGNPEFGRIVAQVEASRKAKR